MVRFLRQCGTITSEIVSNHVHNKKRIIMVNDIKRICNIQHTLTLLSATKNYMVFTYLKLVFFLDSVVVSSLLYLQFDRRLALNHNV